jgi:hypothetical protein
MAAPTLPHRSRQADQSATGPILITPRSRSGGAKSGPPFLSFLHPEMRKT